MPLPSQLPSTAPPTAPMTLAVVSVFWASAIDWTTPLPTMPAPGGTLAQPFSSSTAARDIALKSRISMGSLRRRVQVVHRGEQRPGLPERREPAVVDLADGARSIHLGQRAVDLEP